MNRTIAGAVATAALFLLTPGLAHAQSSGFGVNHFEPSERGSEWFVMESLDLRGHLRPVIGVVGDFAYRPLVVTDADGNLRQSIVRDQFFVHAGGGLVLWDRLRASVNVPIMVFADGNDVLVNGVTYPKPANSSALGDIRLGLDARLIGQYGDVFTGAIGVQVSLPTGDAASYAGDGNARVAPRAVVAGDIGAFVYAAKLGFDIRALDQSYAGGQVGSGVFFGASAGLRLVDKKLVVGPEIFGRSVVTNDAFFSKKGAPVEGLLGAHYTFLPDWRAGLGGSAGLTGGFGSPQLRGVVSLEWVPSIAPPAPPDRDHDGILDADDACPDVPGVKTSDPKTNGCPLPGDRDHDGILDADDACPDVPGEKTDDPKTNGCPPDRDHDGVLDKDDACPDVPGDKTDDPKTNGCPPDRDHDGILDKDDACIDVPGVKTDDAATNGCPADPDRDKDGIKNEEDACPDEPGKPDPDPKKNGCPKAFVQAGQIKILDQVKFKTASADILPGKDSEEVLVAVLDVLKAHTEIKSVRVEGHTDNRGGAAMNKTLSGARAASVVKWLVAHGIDKDRLTSEGFGPDRPLDTNDTEDGRRNNRRVEFHIQE